MKVTRRGQVTIPKSLRERTGIDDGTEVEFHEENGRIVIVRATKPNPFEAWLGYLRRPGDSDNQVQEMRGHRAHGR